MIFAKTFQQLTGNPPVPWQEALYDRFISDRIANIPSSCNLPSILCPLFRGGMEFMRLKCKSQPEVEIHTRLLENDLSRTCRPDALRYATPAPIPRIRLQHHPRSQRIQYSVDPVGYAEAEKTNKMILKKVRASDQTCHEHRLTCVFKSNGTDYPYFQWPE